MLRHEPQRNEPWLSGNAQKSRHIAGQLKDTFINFVVVSLKRSGGMLIARQPLWFRHFY